jgi:hypothetical protein
MRDAGAVPRRTKREDREVAEGELLLGARRDVHLPQVSLPVILLEREHIVLQAIALALRGRGRLGCDEIDRLAVGRPDGRCGSGDAGRMSRQLTRFAAGGVHNEYLCAIPRAGDKEEVSAVGGPAGRGLAAFPTGDLDGSAASGRLAPDVIDLPVRRPIGTRQHVRHEPRVRRQLHVEHARDLGEVHQRHRPGGLRPKGGAERRRRHANCHREEARPTLADGHAEG